MVCVAYQIQFVLSPWLSGFSVWVSSFFAGSLGPQLDVLLSARSASVLCWYSFVFHSAPLLHFFQLNMDLGFR